MDDDMLIQKRQRELKAKAVRDALEKLHQEAENDRMEWEEKLTWDAYELRQRNLTRMVGESTRPYRVAYGVQKG